MKDYLRSATILIIALIFAATATASIFGFRAILASQTSTSEIPIVALFAHAIGIDAAKLTDNVLALPKSRINAITILGNEPVAQVSLGEAALQGNIDSVKLDANGPGLVRGWAVSINPTTHPAVGFAVLHDKIIARAVVSGPRADVAIALKNRSFGNSGFELKLPPLDQTQLCKMRIAILMTDFTMAYLPLPKNECPAGRPLTGDH